MNKSVVLAVALMTLILVVITPISIHGVTMTTNSTISIYYIYRYVNCNSITAPISIYMPSTDIE